MEKRAVVAIVLSLAVWLAWSYFFIKPKQSVHKPATTVKEEPAKKTAPQRETARMTVAAVGQGSAREQRLEIATPRYEASLSTRGAAIERLLYKERNIELVVAEKSFNARGSFDFALHLDENEFLQGGALDNALWNVEKTSERELRFFTSILVNNEQLRVEKRYSFADDGSFFRLTLALQNPGGREIVLPQKSVIISPSDFLGPSMDFENTYNELECIYNVDGSFDKGSKGGGIFSKSTDIKKESGATKWVGIMSRYFLIIMVPEKFTGSGAIYDSRKHTAYRTGMYVPVASIKPRETVTKSFKVYVGEKNKDRLRAVDESIVEAADVSKWIEPIRDFLIWALLKINILFGNFGWSLVIFSIITKVILMPLTIKSTESMKKLQALNPQITELREKYKDKPDVLNKKIMEMYKKNKVNPASGCLPLLLQMPFFFALYSALINSIDLWQAPFVFWIKDLSLPDTVFNLRDLGIDYYFNFNILPIVMTGTTYLQQKMSTGDAVGQQQKMMLMLMPLIFIVIFWNMPSGLVLYWIMQNVLQILHQLYVNKKGQKEVKET